MYGFKQVGFIAKQLEEVIQPLTSLNELQSQQIATLLCQLQQAVKHTEKKEVN